MQVINSKKSYASMAAAILMATIPLDVLLVSNMKGGSSKVPKQDDSKFTALDDHIVRALKGTKKIDFV